MKKTIRVVASAGVACILSIVTALATDCWREVSVVCSQAWQFSEDTEDCGERFYNIHEGYSFACAGNQPDGWIEETRSVTVVCGAFFEAVDDCPPFYHTGTLVAYWSTTICSSVVLCAHPAE